MVKCCLSSAVLILIFLLDVAAAKFFWFLLFMMLTLLYFTYYGVACVAITPNLMMAAILSGAFYGLMNLFAGFVITEPEFPGWWVWVSAHSWLVLCCQSDYICVEPYIRYSLKLSACIVPA